MIRRDMPQYTPEWFAVRRGVPTCSNFSKIITPAKGEMSKSAIGYAFELVAQAVDPAYGAQDDYVSAAMKNGTIMEPEARRFYEFDADATVEPVGFCLTDDGRFGGSPDGLVGADGCLELKSPEPKTQVAYLYRGGLPDEYKPQVHGHIIITGRKWCDFVSYARGLPPLRVRVEPNEYTDALRACLDEFWTIYQAVKDAVPITPPPKRAVVTEEEAMNAMFVPK